MSDPTPALDLDIQQLLRLLPHRFPFLLLDRVVECVPGRYVIAYKGAAKNEAFLSKSGRTLALPRILLLEALAQAAVVLTFKTLRIEPSGKELMFYAGIDSCTFSGTAEAGHRLDLRADIARMLPSRGIGIFDGVGSIHGRTIVRARLIAALRLERHVDDN